MRRKKDQGAKALFKKRGETRKKTGWKFAKASLHYQKKKKERKSVVDVWRAGKSGRK